MSNSSKAPKVFVLDTNVLIHDPRSIFKFQDNDVVLPMTVIEEIDGLKKGMDEKGHNAREVTRLLDGLRKEGKLQAGVALPGGGALRVATLRDTSIHRELPDLSMACADDRILAVAYNLLSDLPCAGRTVVLVTKDANVRIKADGIGLLAEDYENDKVNLQTIYDQSVECHVSGAAIDAIHAGKGARGLALPPGVPDLRPNQGITLHDASGSGKTALARYDAEQKLLFRIDPKMAPQGLSPRNREQAFALDLLLDDNIKLVSLIGKAGTGKTLLALAAGLEGVDDGMYRRVSVARPVVPLGRQEIGFLPGDEEEKLAPWMMPIYDNIEVLVNGVRGGSKPKRGQKNRFGSKDKFAARIHPAEELKYQGLLEVSGLYNIRGRSLPNTYFIIDEAQNLTPHEVKTIITRAGEGTKIVLTGDPDQIDNPYVDSRSNGLTYAADRFSSYSVAGHLTLLKGERSELAELASAIL